MTFELPSWAQVTEKRKGHIARVDVAARRLGRRARRSSSDERRAWIDAGPASRRAQGRAGRRAARARRRRVAYEPQMLHGPAAAALLEREGETRRGVLDAVRYHTIGYLDWDRTGRALYMADFLEPGRSFSKRDRAFLAAQVPQRFRRRLPAGACARSSSGRCTRAIRSFPETVALWNVVPMKPSLDRRRRRLA